MAVTLYHVGRTPGETQFGLDTFTEHFKANDAADVVLIDASVPQRGDAHPSYSFMFVTDRHCTETGPSSSALDVIYMGCMKTSGGLPVLPPSQTVDDDSVMSASSSKAATGLTVASPYTLQFYAPTSTLNFVTYNAKGSKTAVSDPTDQPTIITLTISDTTFTGTTFDVPTIVAAFFSIEIVATIRCQELVASGKYWLNQAKKIKHYVPFIFALPPGYYPQPYASGNGYVIGDTISVTSGGACVMTVTNTFSGQILGVTIVSNALSVASSTPIAAIGGTGSGASYTVVHLT